MIVEAQARKIECEIDGLYFARYFFKQRFGSKMIISGHHKVIQKTLDRVISGEINRLIINMPPGYTKTELSSIFMIARGLAINPKARFLHLSYSDNLALLNSSTARSIVKSGEFQDMWPMSTRDDQDSKGTWYNEESGGVRATSSKGQVTGFRAGHMEPGFTGALIVDDPVKPDDASSEKIRGGVNERYNETIKNRLAVEDVPIIIIMQRIHYKDLSGYLLRGGSGEKWHHLNLPVIVDNSKPYSEENTHGIPIEHNLPDGWLWPFKHNESHRVALTSHRRSFAAQYMQDPPKFDQDGSLWKEKVISNAKEKKQPWKLLRTVIGLDPSTTNSKTSDACGIIGASSYTNGEYSVKRDRTGVMSPSSWAMAAILLYDELDADAIVVEVNQGGDMCELVLRQTKIPDTRHANGFSGRIIKVHASKGKVARAEPIVALYEQDLVHHCSGLYELESEQLEWVPRESSESPNRIDAVVWALTELSDGCIKPTAGVFGR